MVGNETMIDGNSEPSLNVFLLDQIRVMRRELCGSLVVRRG